jgi:hypothetical protein
MWVAAVSLMAVIAIAAVFFYVQQSAEHTQPAWVTTRAVTAGELLGDFNVQLAPVGTAGVPINTFQGDPRHHLAAHQLEARDVIRKADVLPDQMSEVPLTMKLAPDLRPGDTVDVYAASVSGGGTPTPSNARLVLIGRRVIVASTTGGGTGASSEGVTVRVPASDEARWVVAQAGNVLLFAARSQGIGIEPPPLSGLTVSEALSGLSGSSVSGSVLANPTPSPSSKP